MRWVVRAESLPITHIFLSECRYLADNQLTGTIPASPGNMTSLQTLCASPYTATRVDTNINVLTLFIFGT